MTRTPIKKNVKWTTVHLTSSSKEQLPQLKKINAPPFTKQTNKLSMTNVTLLYALR